MCLAFARRAVFAVLFLSVPCAASPGGSPRLADSYGRVALAFEPNRGQADPAVRYLARGHGYTVLLTDDEAVIALQRGERSFVAEMRFEDARSTTPLRAQGELGSNDGTGLYGQLAHQRPRTGANHHLATGHRVDAHQHI